MPLPPGRVQRRRRRRPQGPKNPSFSSFPPQNILIYAPFSPRNRPPPRAQAILEALSNHGGSAEVAWHGLAALEAAALSPPLLFRIFKFTEVKEMIDHHFTQRARGDFA